MFNYFSDFLRNDLPAAAQADAGLKTFVDSVGVLVPIATTGIYDVPILAPSETTAITGIADMFKALEDNEQTRLKTFLQVVGEKLQVRIFEPAGTVNQDLETFRWSWCDGRKGLFLIGTNTTPSPWLACSSTYPWPNRSVAEYIEKTNVEMFLALLETNINDGLRAGNIDQNMTANVLYFYMRGALYYAQSPDVTMPKFPAYNSVWTPARTPALP